MLQVLFWLKGVCKRVLDRVNANDDIIYTMSDIVHLSFPTRHPRIFHPLTFLVGRELNRCIRPRWPAYIDMCCYQVFPICLMMVITMMMTMVMMMMQNLPIPYEICPPMRHARSSFMIPTDLCSLSLRAIVDEQANSSNKPVCSETIPWPCSSYASPS